MARPIALLSWSLVGVDMKLCHTNDTAMMNSDFDTQQFFSQDSDDSISSHPASVRVVVCAVLLEVLLHLEDDSFANPVTETVVEGL